MHFIWSELTSKQVKFPFHVMRMPADAAPDGPAGQGLVSREVHVSPERTQNMKTAQGGRRLAILLLNGGGMGHRIKMQDI